MSDHTGHVKRIITDIWDPSSKVKEEDVDLLFQHLRTSFSDQHALLQALKVDQDKSNLVLDELERRKEQLIDHNLEPD
jgi:hypothetical protein